MQSAFFVLPNQYISPPPGCQQRFFVFLNNFQVPRQEYPCTHESGKEVSLMENRNNQNEREQNQQNNQKEQRQNQKENRK